jgi:hypothetical protein
MSRNYPFLSCAEVPHEGSLHGQKPDQEEHSD